MNLFFRLTETNFPRRDQSQTLIEVNLVMQESSKSRRSRVSAGFLVFVSPFITALIAFSLARVRPISAVRSSAFFVETEREIKADQDMLHDVMRTLGVEEGKVRQAGAWAAEKVDRTRLIIAGDEQGSLGLVLTLEGLTMGVTGKKLMWRALAAAKLPRLNSYNFEQLQCRAEQQIERIEAERISAVCQAFAAAIRSK